MPSLLSAPLRAALQRRPSSAFWLWELYLLNKTYRLAFRPINSLGLGHYAGRVIASQDISRAVSDRDHALQLSQTGITFECTSFDFQRELAGSGGNSIRGARAVALLGADDPTVAYTDYFTAFDGVVAKPQRAGKLQWSVVMHSNDQALRGAWPKTRFLPGDWPNIADLGLYAKPLPVIYGIHDSRGSGDTGLVPCFYVDKLGFRYLVAHGWVTVDRVYKDGALQGGGYSITHPTINGRLYTLIDFTSDQADAVITADVTGYESVGNGSGSLITGANVWAHFLSHFVLSDYQGGNWPATHALISSAHVTATQSYLTDMGWTKVSGYIGGDKGKATGRDANDSFCRTQLLYAFFTNGGKLAIAPDDHRVTTLSYAAPRWFRWDLDELEDSLGITYEDGRLANRVDVDFLYGAAAGSFLQNTEVIDASITAEDLAEPLQMEYSHAGLL